jgi:ribosomal protein L16 Arg81 hydroxylase
MNPKSLTGATEAVADGRPPLCLAELIAPTTVETFLSDYWNTKPLVIHRDAPASFADILTLADVDHIIANSSLHDGDLRLVTDGVETAITELLPKELEGKTNGLELLYNRFRAGATINLTFLHERWPPIAALCRALATELSASVHGNVYLTPPGTRGLKPHHDTHDVFVLQMYGTKHWLFYPTQTPLPLREHPLYMLRGDETPGEPIADFVLRPGDIAYLPRGTVHAATANDDVSLHLTIGMTPMVWADIARSVVDRVLLDDKRFRSALPLGFATDPDVRRTCVSYVTELLGGLVSEPNAKLAIDTAARKTTQRCQPVLAGHLLDLAALPGVDMHTRVRVRPQLRCYVTRDDDEIHLDFHGKTIDLPEYVEDEIAFVLKADEFTGADIPGSLDDDGRLVLVRQLLREGLLTLST